MKTLNLLAVTLTCLSTVRNAHGLTINARDCGAAANGVPLVNQRLIR